MEQWFFTSIPPVLFIVYQSDSYLFSGVWGFLAGLSGFASHWCGLHLGAGCQQWKLQDFLGTQPRLNDAVVKAGIEKQGPYI